jgi:hypothetical protein
LSTWATEIGDGDEDPRLVKTKSFNDGVHLLVCARSDTEMGR